MQTVVRAVGGIGECPADNRSAVGMLMNGFGVFCKRMEDFKRSLKAENSQGGHKHK